MFAYLLRYLVLILFSKVWQFGLTLKPGSAYASAQSNQTCSYLLTSSLDRIIYPCVQLLCAQRNAPCQWDLAIDKAKPPASAAEWQGNDQTDLQCQAKRHCHHQVQWATCAAWDWGSGPHSEGENAPMVQSRQLFTYRLKESMGLGGPRWHGSSWQRGIAESGSSRLSTLMIDIPGDMVCCHACSKPAIWKGAHWCGCCPCTCMLIKTPIMIWWSRAQSLCLYSVAWCYFVWPWFTYLVIPGIAPTLQVFDLFKLLIILLFPVFGNPKKSHGIIMSIAQDKALFSTKNCWYFFLFFHENICCGYSLEVPQWGVSNEYQNMFLWKIRNIFVWYPLLYGAMYVSHTYTRGAGSLGLLAISIFYLKWDTLTPYYTSPKIWKNKFYHILMCQKIGWQAANRVVTDQMSHSAAFDLGYTVCPGLFVPMLTVNTVCRHQRSL